MLHTILRRDRNLFIRLYRNRPHGHVTPKENFVTESFAINLAIDKRLLQEFFQTYLQENLPDGLYIDTQVKHGDSIFDIVFANDKDFYWIVECKMTAPFPQNIRESPSGQLDRYAEILEKIEAKNKGMIAITLRNPPTKEYLNVNFIALRWMDVRDFFRDFSSDNPVAESLRVQFVELLEFLKVDRTLYNGRLLWRCDICGLEMAGQGISSHQEKHCREYSYVVDNENKKKRDEFLSGISPYEKNIDYVLQRAREFSKIEMNNYSDSEQVFRVLESSGLPQNLWLYVIKRLGFCFSNKAFVKFQKEAEERLKNVVSKEEPHYIRNDYRKLLLYMNTLEDGALKCVKASKGDENANAPTVKATPNHPTPGDAAPVAVQKKPEKQRLGPRL